ncbi:MAG: hypothetical protein QOG21_2038 [Actinomycetota bacterium]|nr:hypothetical protein [Actinomycetota bacterium]
MGLLLNKIGNGKIRKGWAVALSGCVLLVVLAVLAGAVFDARTQPVPAIDHVADVLGAGGFTCGDAQSWSIPPKGQSTLSCDRFEIDAFNNHAAVSRFLGWKEKPQDEHFLKRFGVDAFIVKGPRWILFTPSANIAAELRSRVGGQLLTISR